jgi:hypothetical protein
VDPAVAERVRAIRRGRVVALGIPPPVLWRMSEATIQLHNHRVGLIYPVAPSASAAWTGERHLPPRLRQPVRPLHVARVAELEHGLVAIRGRVEELFQICPVLKPATRLDRRPEPYPVRQPPRERPRHPPAHVIKSLRRIHQIQDGLLHRRPCRISDPRSPRRTVEAHARNRDDTALTGNGHVNRIRLLVGQPVYLGRGLIAEHGTRARMQNRRPDKRTATRLPGKRQVDARVDLLPPATSYPELDLISGKPARRACDRETTPH